MTPKHLCDDKECPSLGQPSSSSCRCHKTAEQMLTEVNERLRAAQDEADALIMDLSGFFPLPVAYPTGAAKATAFQNWKARCVERDDQQGTETSK